jgi:hypothetical protein
MNTSTIKTAGDAEAMALTGYAGLPPMTAHQKAVLRWMDETRTGAVLFEGEYRFPEAFRRDAGLAQRFDARRCGH